MTQGIGFPHLVRRALATSSGEINDWIQQDQEANNGVLNQIREAIQQEKAFAFVGSGCSIPLGYPSWQEFIAELIKKCQGKYPHRTAEFEHLKRTNILFAAEECKKNLDISIYCSFIQKRFGPRTPSVSGEHKILWQLFRQILTSNYDPCLENALCEMYRNENPHIFSYSNEAQVPQFINLVERNARVLFYVHGRHDEPEKCIVTLNDYQNHYSKDDIRQACTTLFDSRSVVFIGFGLTDSYLMRIPDQLVAIYKGRKKQHYAILPYPSDVEPWTKRDELLQLHGVHTAFYPVTGDDHSKRLELLKKLLLSNSH
jgi:hypothetical protein